MANKTIGQLPPADLPVLTSDLFIVSRDGSTTKQVSGGDLAAFATEIESAARQAADLVLQQNIDAEAVLRLQGDEGLQTQVNNEIQNRIAGDNSVRSDLINLIASVSVQSSQDPDSGTRIKGALFAGFYEVVIGLSTYLIPRFVPSGERLKTDTFLDFQRNSYSLLIETVKANVFLDFENNLYQKET